MKKVFVDTNILEDLIADRKPFSKFAIDFFSKAESGNVSLYTSSHSISTTHYLLKKYLIDKELREVLLNLLDFIYIIAKDIDFLKKRVKSKHKDFEDALQIISVYSIEKIDCIVTRNLKRL